MRLCLACMWWKQSVQQYELNSEGRTETTAIHRDQKLQIKNPPESKFPQTKSNHWLNVANGPTTAHSQSTHSCIGQTDLCLCCKTLLYKKENTRTNKTIVQGPTLKFGGNSLINMQSNCTFSDSHGSQYKYLPPSLVSPYSLKETYWPFRRTCRPNRLHRLSIHAAVPSKT